MSEQVKIAIDGDFGAQVLMFFPEGPSRQAAITAVPGEKQSAEDFAGITEGMTTAGWLGGLLGRGVALAIPQMMERRADHHCA
jgi:hypothetical protein